MMELTSYFFSSNRVVAAHSASKFKPLSFMAATRSWGRRVERVLDLVTQRRGCEAFFEGGTGGIGSKGVSGKVDRGSRVDLRVYLVRLRVYIVRPSLAMLVYLKQGKGLKTPGGIGGGTQKHRKTNEQQTGEVR